MPFYPHPKIIKYEVKDITVNGSCVIDQSVPLDEVTLRFREHAEAELIESVEQSLLLALMPHVKVKRHFDGDKLQMEMSIELAVRSK